MKTAITTVEKAWYYFCDSIDGISDAPFQDRITRGETLGKAKYALYKHLADLGWYVDFKEFCQEFTFRRFPDLDLVRVPAAPVLETLTEQQRHIIGHANGNDSGEPGFRDYYCTTDGNPECEGLVSLGLMKHGRTLYGCNTSRYYLLTESGAAAALSDAVITRAKSQHIFKPSEPALLSRGDFIDLESIKANPALRQNFDGMSCLIYSWQWGYYWRPNGCGYGCKDEAGIYQFNDAVDRTHHCGPEKGIWFELLKNESSEVAA